MVIRSPILGSCTLAIVPIVGVLNKIYGDWLGRNAKRVQNALAETTTCAHEALSCIKTVITLASEDHELEKYTSGIEKLYNLNIQQLIATAVYYMSVSTFLVNTCVQASLLLIGTIFVEQERLTVEDNIKHGSSASFQDVVAASRIANAHNFIESFPNKYYEQVGERGQALSG